LDFRHKTMAWDVLTGVQPAEEFALDPPGTEVAGDAAKGAWFEAVFRREYPRVAGMLARLTGDRGQAEEIAADVFCKLSRRSPRPHDGDGLTAWIYRVAINAGLDAVRANARRHRHEHAAGAEALRVAAPADALDDLLRRERGTRVRAVLAALKPREAQLLLLRSSGMAYREVAAALGIQPGSVGTLLARAEQEFERKFRTRYGDCV
jgi:RNA polymerase sigma-70 factor (ECF subfamily)